MVFISGNLFRKIAEVVHFWGIKNILPGVNIALKYFVEVEKCYFTVYVEKHGILITFCPLVVSVEVNIES